MKIQKYRLDRKTLKEIVNLIISQKDRIRFILGYISNLYKESTYIFNFLIEYFNILDVYSIEIKKILLSPGEKILITSELMERLNNHKRKIDSLEKEINEIPYISTRVH